MAFTKAPEYNTHQTVRLIPKMTVDVVSPNISPNVFTDFAITNAYLVKEGEEYVAHNAPPYKLINLPTVSQGAGGATSPYFPKTGGTAVWFVRDQDLVQTAAGGGGAVITSSAFNITNAGRRKGWANYRVGNLSYHAAVDAGNTVDSYIHYFNDFGIVVTTATLPNTRINPDIVFLDGYFFVCSDNNNPASPGRIYNSTLGNPSLWNLSTDFIDAEMEGDTLKGLAKHHNHLVAFGDSTIEFFYNSGNELGSPLQRQASYSRNIGLRGNHVTVGDRIFFIGVENEVLGFYKIEKFNVTRINFFLLDQYLNKTSSDNISFDTPNYKLSAMSLEHGPAIVFSATFNFNACIAYQIEYGTFSNFYYLSDLGYRNTVEILPLGSGNVMFATDPNTSTINIVNFIPSDDAGDMLWPGASLYFQNEGFGSDSQKHIKWVDVNGLFRSNNSDVRVALSAIKGKEIYGELQTNCGEKTTNLIPNDAPLRWRNLGRSRYHTYKVSVNGTGKFRVDNLELAYNLGTY